MTGVEGIIAAISGPTRFISVTPQKCHCGSTFSKIRVVLPALAGYHNIPFLNQNGGETFFEVEVWTVGDSYYEHPTMPAGTRQYQQLMSQGDSKVHFQAVCSHGRVQHPTDVEVAPYYPETE